MRQVDANGIRFAYVEAGPQDGPLALCLHGFPDVPGTWDALLAQLGEAGFHAVAPYMRGYAPSGPAPDGGYHIADLALDALALADALAGDEAPVVVGHDWGAVATWTAAARRPERFSRVVTMAVPHPGTLASHLLSPEIIRNSWYQYFFQMPIAESVVAMDDFRFIDVLWESWSPGRTPDPAHLRAVKECLGADGVLHAAIGYYRATIGGDWEPSNDELAAAAASIGGTVPAPTLYLHGAQDAIYPAEMIDVDEMRTFVPNLDLGVVEGAGHFLHLERPDVVLPRIVDFLTP